jgi:hypothetical protein
VADTANDLSGYLADCLLCGESIFDFDTDYIEYEKSYAHRECILEYAEERCQYEPDWSQE